MTNLEGSSRGERNVHMPHIGSRRRHPLPVGGASSIAPDAGQDSQKTGILSRPLSRRGLLRLAVAGTGAGAAALAFNKADRIASIFESLTSTPTPVAFDNKTDKGVIGANNEHVVTDADLESIPSFDSNNKPILLFPIKNPPADLQMSYNKEQGVGGWKPDVLAKTKQDGTKDTFTLSSVPTGAEFVAPIDSRVFSLTDSKTGIVTGVKIEFMGPDNTLYFLMIFPTFGQQPLEERMSLSMNFPINGPDNSNGREWKKGTFATKGTTLFKSTKQTDFELFMQGGTNGSLGADGVRIPGDIQFATDPSTSKIIVAN